MTPTKRPTERPPPDLTDDEIIWIRELREQHEHETWLRGQVKVLWPWVLSIVGAIVAAAMWIKDHVKL